MSTTPKRLPEEGSHSHVTPSKRTVEDGVLSSGGNEKQTQPSYISEPHSSFDPGQDGRAEKMPRLEQHDVIKQAAVCLKNQISSSSDDPCVDHPLAATNGLELKEIQDKKNANFIGELSAEMKVASQGNKAELDVMSLNRDEKRLKNDWESWPGSKGDAKLPKDGHTVHASHVNRNEPKEHHKSKRWNERVKDDLEISRKDVQMCEDGEVLKTHETSGKHWLDLKGEQKTKEKERRRKDENHKEKIEHQDHLKVAKNNLVSKEHVREDRETEKKVPENDKEQNEVGKLPDGSIRTPVKGVDSSEHLKAYEGENNVQKREKEPGGDKQEKNNRRYEKESEERHAGVKEGDKDALAYGVQERKRMMRSRGMSQSSHQEPRLHSQPREDERSQGKDDLSLVTYKVGECMQELLKFWKEFETSAKGKMVESFENCPTLEIRIPPELATKSNRQVKGAQLWGTDIYTNDSDLVAVLMHTGYCKQTASLPSQIKELRATIRVLPPQQRYHSTLRNGIHSRPWGSGVDCSFRVESCCVVKRGGGAAVNLQPQLALISFVEPTLIPLSLDRAMNTRAAASNTLRQQRFIQEVAVQYNLCNEPWIKYSVNAVSDKGPKKPLYTSARLKKGEVLYLETQVNRYELCFSGENGGGGGGAPAEAAASGGAAGEGEQGGKGTDGDDVRDVFRWSRCKRPLPQKLMLSIGVPLPEEHLEVLEEKVEWEDVQWAKTGVWVAGKEYPIVRLHFLSPN